MSCDQYVAAVGVKWCRPVVRLELGGIAVTSRRGAVVQWSSAGVVSQIRRINFGQ